MEYIFSVVDVMGSKNHRLFEELSADEQNSLGKLCGCSCDPRIPDAHAEKFLGLGLVEVSCGGVSATSAGRYVWMSRLH